MKGLILFFAIGILFTTAYAQNAKVEKAIPYSNQLVNPTYGADFLITANRPIGPVSGIQKQSDGKIYLAVNDTLTTSNLGLVLFQSTNYGMNWTLFGSGINLRIKYMNIKMVRTGLDSLYCFFQAGNNVYSWNFLTGNFKQFDSANVGYFDAVGSSTGSLYLIMNHVPLNQLRRYGSSNGGASWVNPGYIQANGCMPKTSMSGSGDTIYLNYYSPVLADTATSIIRQARYRETAPATIASAGFQDVATETVAKTEFLTAAYKGSSWFFYSVGTTGNINVKCRVSTDAGTTYATAFDIAANPNVDEYWLDARYYSVGNGGVDFTYYSDSLQTGNPTNNTDKLMTVFASVTNPGVFSTPTRVSNHPPGWSSAMYVPKIVEIYSTGKVGMAWVGFDVSAYKLYWAADFLTSVENNNNTPVKYSLSQNYPNPFNPVTKINFDIAKSGLARLTVFDMLGREIQTLVNKYMTEGSYSINFNGAKLSSGVYFYKLEVNKFSEIKKMMLVK